MDNEKEDKRKSEEHKQHLKSIGFQKGMQRHPKAGRRPTPDVLKQRLADLAPDAIAVIYELMMSADKDATRLSAAQTIVAPFIAKAPRSVNVRHEHSLADLVHEINSGGKTIDATPVHEDAEYLEYDEDDSEV
ncbi:hypothetical protein G6L37_11930 [Agrobacterium rubi]|uniref:hypothetical protein n=1 Tax=Agrobacterium rubi TaxID=28099 RepID=UPI0015744C12|nr:hypothetical protein [Agrobacterium rubi]NTF06871.1 hypothetical protein [Agrobacterium rubi]NTF19113.1 hypothetical protein [Agrobacterium rubi]NTF26076.1 hypothetical protein [Agrobacterium rubi]